MNVLLVHVHPERRSICSSLCASASEQLHGLGHEVRVSDLYAQNFDPFAGTGAGHVRCERTASPLSRSIRDEIGWLAWCDLLILNFPVLGYSIPTILEGWIDRVLVSGTALPGKRVLVSATLGAQQRIAANPSVYRALDARIHRLLQGLGARTGMTVLPPFVDWNLPAPDREAPARLLHCYQRHLAQIDTIRPASCDAAGNAGVQSLPA